MNAVMEKYRALTEREQHLVLVSAVFVVIALFYWGVWTPLNQSLDQQRELLSNQQSLLVWVQERVNRAQQLRRSGSSRPGFNGSLPQAVNSTTNRFNIVIARMQPQGDELQVMVEDAPFNDVLSWLQALEAMGITILQADFAEANVSGHIKIRRLQLGKS
ncbi:type II secretion system protein M [Alteromonas aestuariivivens]|uniref:Type II secretion system protein M n=1 Tax=Alteromonas aestuariivivens TaxID=1938339 RepID=A0A3D8M6T8_9ALTE|nr:type II secretion system protein M [Alteromonas aestuariivivens]RDV24872.1 type II secretion system protein M [Alteromonas aestuariivivens]